MPYKPRDNQPGFHHVVTRGNNKQRIFLNNRDRREFIRILTHVANRHGWTIYAYCLMRNHYHLVLNIDDRGLSRGMCELNSSYALAFNGTHRRINHLFGKRYWSEHLPDDRRLLNVVRYVVQNPRRAGRAGSLESYAWSSYAATIGVALSFAQLATGELLALFADRRERAVARFVEFCDGGGESSHGPRQPP
ncbi:MAG TPA: transposase [Gaiellaceae bacterium]|nr:transposase [Gaiellaceae bacterium]